MASKFEHVLLLTGNHEYYGEHTMEEVDEAIEAICAKRDNLHFLNRRVWDVPGHGVRFAGCTLWTHINKEQEQEMQSRVSDFRKIMLPHPTIPGQKVTLDVAHYNAMNAACRAFLKATLVDEHCPEKVVILTHHAPVASGVSSPFSIMHHPHIASVVDGCDLEDILKHPKVIVAAHGHTHMSEDMVLYGKTRLVSNQLGYLVPRNEIALFRPGLVIDCRDHLANVDSDEWVRFRAEEEKKVAEKQQQVLHVVVGKGAADESTPSSKCSLM